MRTWSSAEQNAFLGNVPEHNFRVRVEDSTGTLQTWTDYGFVKSVSWGDSLDQPHADGELTVDWRNTPYRNLSPFVSGFQHSGWLDFWREVVVEVKVIPPGGDPSAFSWIECARGRLDDYDLSAFPATVPFSDKIGRELMSQFIGSSSVYSSGDVDDIEDVIGDFLTDHDKYSNSLYAPTATLIGVKEYTQQQEPILQAAQTLAMMGGWDVRPRWDDGTSQFRLELYEPDRSKSTTDHTVPADHIVDVGSFRGSVSNIRNWVKVTYGDIPVDEPTRAFVERLSETSPAHDPTGSIVSNSSIDNYGWQKMVLHEGTGSLVQDQSAAENLADAALSDLADVTIIAGVTLPYIFWPVQLNDYYTFAHADIRMDGDTDFAVLGYRHTIDEQGPRTELTLMGKPSLGKAAWQRLETGRGAQQPPDDLAPDAPGVTITNGEFDITLEIDYPTHRDYDQFLIYRSSNPVFTPSSDNLIYQGRTTRHTFLQKLVEPSYFKVKVRDRWGNLSTAAGNTIQLLGQPTGSDPGLGIRLTSDTTLAAAGTLVLDKVVSGEFLGWWNTSTGRFTVPEDGTYEFDFRGRIDTTMAEGASNDFTIELIRDPDGVAETVGTALVTEEAGNVHTTTLRKRVPLDEDDVLEFQVIDQGGTFANITFREAYTELFIEQTAATESRSSSGAPTLNVPTYVEPEFLGTYSGTGGDTQAMLRYGGVTIVTQQGASGSAYEARMIQRNKRCDYDADLTFEISGSTDYYFTSIAADSLIYLGAMKLDATAAYGVRAYSRDGTEQWSTDFGGAGSIEVRGLTLDADEDDLWAVTDEGSAGKIRRLTASDGTVEETSADLGAALWGVATVDQDTIVVTANNSTTDPTVFGYASDDLSTELWTLDLDGLGTHPGDTGENTIEANPAGTAVYLCGGDGSANPNIYKISASGSVEWSVDVGDDSGLADVTFVSSLDVHASGDVYVIAVYDDGTSDYQHELLVYQSDGSLKWKSSDFISELEDFDWPTSTEVPLVQARGLGTAIVGLSASTFEAFHPYDTIPGRPPRFGLTEDWDPATLSLADGDSVLQWTDKISGKPLRNTTASQQPAFRASTGSISQPAVDFDGSDDALTTTSDLSDMSSGVRYFVVGELDTIGDDEGFFEVIPAGETNATPSLAAYYENDDTSWRSAANVDVSETHFFNDASVIYETGAAHVWSGDHAGTSGMWLDDHQADPDENGSNLTPDNTGPLTVGQGLNGAALDGQVYRLLFYATTSASSAPVRAVQHWLRNWYGIGALSSAEKTSLDDGQSEVYVPFGLSQDQFENQSWELALRAKADQVWASDAAASDTDSSPPTRQTISDEDFVGAWMDASPAGHLLIHDGSAGRRPIWQTTPAYYSQAVEFNGAQGLVDATKSHESFNFLHDGTSDFTVIIRLAINEDATNNTGRLITTRSSGSVPGVLFGYGGGAGDLFFGMHDSGGSFQSLALVSWASFSQDTLYDIVVTYDQSADAGELLLDGVSQDTGGLTGAGHQTGDQDRSFVLGSEDGGNSNDALCEMLGVVIASQVLSTAEIDAALDWIKAAQ